MKKNGFTLAETLITLSILGIVAAITIPSLVGRQIENQNRTKLKKAMATYEKVINNILIENDLQTEDSFKAWAKKDATTNNYQEQVGYFKVAEMSTLAGSENCRFKTGERIWWDICGVNDSNIENAIVILDEKYKDTPRTGENGLEALAKVEKVDGKKVYVYALVGHRDATTGSVRVDDKAYETTSPNKEYLEKDYAFLEKRNITSDSDENNGNDSTETEETACTSVDCLIAKYGQKECSDKMNCIYQDDAGHCEGDMGCIVKDGDMYTIIDENGNLILIGNDDCGSTHCYKYNYYDNNNNLTLTKLYCERNGENCLGCFDKDYNMVSCDSSPSPSPIEPGGSI